MLKMKLIDYPTIYSTLIIVLCAGIFIGFILTMVYVKDVLNDEFTVSVVPIGFNVNPYDHSLMRGRIHKQDFRIVFKNGNQVFAERLGYTHGE